MIEQNSNEKWHIYPHPIPFELAVLMCNSGTLKMGIRDAFAEKIICKNLDLIKQGHMQKELQYIWV